MHRHHASRPGTPMPVHHEALVDPFRVIFSAAIPESQKRETITKGIITKADEKAAGVRPYAVLIKPQQVLGWRYKVVNGRPVLTQFRYLETVEEEVGAFGVEQIEQIRVLEIGRWATYRQQKGKKWALHDEGENTLNETIDGQGGGDVIVGGGGADTLTGGAGIDAFIFSRSDSVLDAMDTITDYRASGGSNGGALDIITLTDVEAVVSPQQPVVMDLNSQANLASAVNFMASSNVVDEGLLVFVWGGDTYAYVEQVGSGTEYVDTDWVIKISGTPFTVGTALDTLGIDGIQAI